MKTTSFLGTTYLTIHDHDTSPSALACVIASLRKKGREVTRESVIEHAESLIKEHGGSKLFGVDDLLIHELEEVTSANMRYYYHHEVFDLFPELEPDVKHMSKKDMEPAS